MITALVATPAGFVNRQRPGGFEARFDRSP